MCSSRIDETVVLLKLVTLSISSVVEVASWTLTLKEAGSNLLFKFFHLSFCKIQTEGSWFYSNPLNNSTYRGARVGGIFIILCLL